MHVLDTYQSDAVERPLFRRRLFWALVASLLLHVVVVLWFHHTRLPSFNAPTERLVPRIFNVKTVLVDQKLLDGEDKDSPQPKQEAAKLPALAVPDDKPVANVAESKATPALPATPDLAKPILNEKPTVSPNETQTLAQVQDPATAAMNQDLDAIKDQLLTKAPAGAPNSLIKLPDESGEASHTDSAGMAAASKRLDKLISGGLHAGEAPVTLPGGALFEFDSSELRPAAIEQLRKLGELIRKNPAITFSIEGYTDSFGDPAYNLQLSQARAESVRTWLVQNMDADPAHIRAVGYGATKFLAQPRPVDMHSQPSIDAEKLHEQQNRRVEIRFNGPKGPRADQ